MNNGGDFLRDSVLATASVREIFSPPAIDPTNNVETR